MASIPEDNDPDNKPINKNESLIAASDHNVSLQHSDMECNDFSIIKSDTINTDQTQQGFCIVESIKLTMVLVVLLQLIYINQLKAQQEPCIKKGMMWILFLKKQFYINSRYISNNNKNFTTDKNIVHFMKMFLI